MLSYNDLQVHGKVLAIIPVYNGEKYVSDAIDSILTQNHPKLRILAIDDCSQDHSIEVLKRYHDRVTIIRNERNLGFAATLNKAISLSDDEDFLLVLSQDCAIIGPDWINIALRHFRDERVGIVTGESMTVRNENLPLVRRVFMSHLCETVRDTEIGETSLTLLKADLFRLSTLRSVDGFSSSANWKFASEDNLISYKMRSAGYKIIKNPVLSYSHHGGQSTLLSNLKREALYARGAGWAIGKGLAEINYGQSKQIKKKILSRIIQTFYVALSVLAILLGFVSYFGFYIFVGATTIYGIYLLFSSSQFRRCEKIYFITVGFARSWIYIPLFMLSMVLGLLSRIFGRRDMSSVCAR